MNRPPANDWPDAAHLSSQVGSLFPLQHPDVDGGHEVDLQPVVAHDSIQVRRRIVRPENRGTEPARQRLQLLQVPRCFAEHEIEIHGRHRCALERRGCMADQDDVEPGFCQAAADFDEEQSGVHYRTGFSSRS
jgi:hypothetical protein